jgi:cell division protein FtsB
VFLRDGFSMGEEPAPVERVEALEHQYASLRDELRRETQELRDERTELAASIHKLEQALEASTKRDRRRRGPGANG